MTSELVLQSAFNNNALRGGGIVDMVKNSRSDSTTFIGIDAGHLRGQQCWNVDHCHGCVHQFAHQQCAPAYQQGAATSEALAMFMLQALHEASAWHGP